MDFTSHHAYLLLGQSDPTVLLNGSDVYYEEFDTLGIHDSRRLRELASRRPRDASGRRLVIKFNAITHEAQNALLKALEEPAPGNRFLLLTNRPHNLLPTLVSRCQVVEMTETPPVQTDMVKKFISAAPEAKLEMVNKILTTDEENTKGAAIGFLNNLEKFLAQQLDQKVANPDLIFALAQIRTGRDYLTDKAGLPRMILEHIALVL